MDVEIVKITWWRTYLMVVVEGSKTVKPILALIGEDVKHEFYLDPEHGHPNRYKLNIAIAAGRALLEKGSWIFIDGATGQPLGVSDSILLDIESYARSFFFKGDTQLYSVRFFVPNTDCGVPQIGIDVEYYKRDRKPQKDVSIKKLLMKCVNLYYQILSRVFKKDGTRILLMSENNETISGNLAAIDARIKERGLDKVFRVSYSFRNIYGGKKSIVNWISVVTNLAKQDYIFVEDYVPIFAAIDVNKNTKLIQVWHAGFGFKAVGFGRFGIEGSPNPFHSCHRKYTYALVGNPYLREIYSEVFGIEKEALLATGMPRLDHFLDEENVESAHERLKEVSAGISGRKTILFAPTYRGMNQRHAHYDFGKVDFRKLFEYCEKYNAVVLFKMHRFISDPTPIPPAYRGCMFDVSEYNINDLFYMADALITDYSSCFYDYILLGKPILFYCYDKALYTATRGVHRLVDDVAPGKVCTTFDDLLVAMENLEKQNAPQIDDKRLIDRCASRCGLASDAVIDVVLLRQKVPGVCLE